MEVFKFNNVLAKMAKISLTRKPNFYKEGHQFQLFLYELHMQ